MTNDTNDFNGIDISSGRIDSELDSANSRIKRVNFNTFSSSDYATNEAYKSLRTNIFFCGTGIKTILLTSCDENEGKSTIATELTKSLAEYGKRTLLIDADMRKSVMLKKGAKGHDIIGLSEVLSGLATAEDAIYHTQDINFDVIFSGHFPPNPVELIGNGNFTLLLDELKKIYDYIIIDSPPLGLVIDAAEIAAFCDGAIMIISNGKISRNNAKQVKAQIEKSGCRLLGAVLNETDKDRRLYKKYYYGKNEYR